MKSEFGGLLLDVPGDWSDITPDEEDYPPTLARDDGAGVLQFSDAAYESGEKPDIDEAALTQLFQNFCKERKIRIAPERMRNAAVLCVGGMEKGPEFLTAVWLLTNGMDVALVTYTAETGEPDLPSELAIAKQIIASATFPRAE
jgi:hypothetical protein